MEKINKKNTDINGLFDKEKEQHPSQKLNFEEIQKKIEENISIPGLVNLKHNRSECIIEGNPTSHSPSFEYFPTTDSWFCHKCNVGGNVIALFAHINNMTYKEAFVDLCKTYKIPLKKQSKKEIEDFSNVQDLHEEFTDLCHQNLLKSKYYNFVKKKRGFTDDIIKKFKIGLIDKKIQLSISKKYPTEILYKGGFISAKKNWMFGKRIVYPYLNSSNKTIYYIFRLIDEEPDFKPKAKYIKLSVSGKRIVKNQLFGINSLSKFRKIEELIITEGITDAISVIQAGFPCLSPVTTKFRDKDMKMAINYCKRFKKTIVINDEEINKEGLKGAEKSVKFLFKNGINVFLGQIPNPEGLDKIDLDDYLKPYTIEGQNEKIKELIENSVPAIDYFLTLLREGYKKLTSIQQKSVFKREQFKQIIEIIPESDELLKSDIKEIFHKEFKAPKKLTDLIIKEVSLDKEKERLRHEIKKTERLDIDIEGFMTQAEKEECDQWLASPAKDRYKLIFSILNFLVVGENKNKKLLFFLMLGNLSKSLMSFIGYKGESSSGKSYVTDEVLKLFPTNTTYRLDGASEQALKYDEELNEKIRIIYLRELKMDSPIIDYLKTMHDYDPILKTVEKEDEHFITRTIKKNRTGLIMTFSFEKIPQDLQNRIWMITPDQTYTQTKDIITTKLKQEHNLIQYDIATEKMEKKLKMIQNSIMILDPTLIPYISFANILKPMFSEKKIRIRRDINKFLILIKTITIFNQKNRTILERKNGLKYIFSEFEDFKMAYEIGWDYFLKTTLDIDDIKKEILNFMEIIEDDDNDPYTLREILEEIQKENSVSRDQVRYKLNGLGREGYVDINRQGRGKPALYKKIKHFEISKIDLKDFKEEIDKIVKKQIELNKNIIKKEE